MTHSTSVSAPTSGLVGYWNFDEGSGSMATDSSGSGNTGTLTNGPSWTTGKVGGGLSFDGSNDQVATGNVSHGSSNISISAWIKPTVNTTGW